MQWRHSLEHVIKFFFCDEMIYTMSQKKTSHYNIVNNFAKCWPIFQNFSLPDSVVNMQLSHHTLNMSLHYLVKHQCRKNSENLKHA